MDILMDEIRRMLEKAGVGAQQLEKPPRPEMGDAALPCFPMAKEMRKSPADIAREIAGRLNPSGMVARVEALGPYVNFHADWKKLGGIVLREALSKKDSFGSGKKRPGRVMVEFAHPNTHKTFHVGHLRNIVLGEALSRTLEFAGNKVVRANYQGDIGPHVARCLWGMLNLGMKEPAKDKGKWLGLVYIEAGKKAKVDPRAEEGIRKINKELYAREPKIAALWMKTRKWSLDYFDSIYREFGAKFDRLYFESEVEAEGVKLAKRLLAEGKAKLSEGAIVIDLESDGLGVFLLLTQDGTPLYSVKDFVLAGLQDREFGPERIVHVVGSEQDLYFRQLFRSLERVNPAVAKKEVHLSYGLVNLGSEGKMSSREGKVILYEEVRERLLGMAEKVTREKNPKLGKALLARTARSVALGALKYDMVKVSPEKAIAFDWDRALSFEGNHAPYLQYTHARCRSILRKAGSGSPGAFDSSLLTEEKEVRLLRKLHDFPEVVEKAAREMRPHHFATFAYELCDLFNEFYQFVPVIPPGGKLTKARLALVAASAVALRNSLRMLGIDAPEMM